MNGHIYFLFYQNELTYIGQSKNVVARVAWHLAYMLIDNVRIIECSADKLKHYEERLIRIFKPKVNVIHNPGGSYSVCPWRGYMVNSRISDFPELQAIRKAKNDAKGMRTINKKKFGRILIKVK